MDKIIYEKVGERLKIAREMRHITLEEAGEKVKVHKSTILRWENGKTEKFKITVLETLAYYYNVNPAWLMGYDVPMNENTNNVFISNNDIEKALEQNYGHTFVELSHCYQKLNDTGKEKALENVKDLAEIPKYTETKPNIQEA